MRLRNKTVLCTLLILTTGFSQSSIAGDKKARVSTKFFQALESKVVDKRPTSHKKIFKSKHKDEFRDGMPDLLARIDEEDYLLIKRDITIPLNDIFRSGNLSKISNLGVNGKANGLTVGINLKSRNEKSGIHEFVWQVGKSSHSITKEFANFKKIIDAEVFGYSVKSHKLHRSPKTYEMLSAEVLARFDVRGINKQGNRQTDRGTLKLNVTKKGSKWVLKKIQVINGETLVAYRKPAFQNVTASAIPEIKSYVRGEAIRRGGYALSTADYNGDGNGDIYVGSMEKSQLFVGDGTGKYKEAKNSGLKNENLVKSAIFGDFFKTGQQDLLLVRFSPTASRTSGDDIIMYKNLGKGKFKRAYTVKNREKSDYAMPAAVSDFNKDGYLDFYVGFPGPRDFTFLEGSLGVKNGDPIAVQGLFMNNKKDAFVRSSKFSQHSQSFNGDQMLAPHSAVSVDYDMDGDMDIFVVDDRGNLSPIYRNDGKGNFDQVAEKIGLGNFQYGMGSALGDIDGDGHLDIAMSNVNFNSALRINNSSQMNYGASPLRTGLNGLRLAKGKNGQFSDITRIAGLNWPGEGVAGVEFVDYNNDGNLDIYVANGLWSGTKRNQDISSLYSRYVWKLGATSSDGANELDVMQDLLSAEHEVAESYLDARSHFMNILATFKGDIVNEKSKLKARPSLAGFQRNRLYRNNGDSTFTEVGFLEGVDSIADGYIIGKTDINNDGKMDLILRNGDPGSVDVKFSPVEVYLNKSKNENSVMLTLKSRKSNYDAIGSIVEAKIGKRKLVRQLLANNGTSQSQYLIHFGLGDNEKIDELTVRWPSGDKGVYRNLKKGRHVLVEGKSVKKFAVK